MQTQNFTNVKKYVTSTVTLIIKEGNYKYLFTIDVFQKYEIVQWTFISKLNIETILQLTITQTYSNVLTRFLILDESLEG